MIVFELLVNGELVARAGADDLSVLSHSVSARCVLGNKSPGPGNVRDSAILEASITGLTSRLDNAPHEHQVWYGRTLSVGDELTVRIVEASSADPPNALHSGAA